MARLSTYRVRHKESGEERVINQRDYHNDLKAWEGWQRVGESGADGAIVEIVTQANDMPVDLEGLDAEALRLVATEEGIKVSQNLKDPAKIRQVIETARSDGDG